MASQMPKNVCDATQIAYNIANVVDGLVGNAASATKMFNNIAPIIHPGPAPSAPARL